MTIIATLKRHLNHKHLHVTCVTVAASALVVCSTGLAATISSSDLYDSHGMFRLGIMNYSKTDGSQAYAGSASVLNYEYSRFTSYNQAIILGYRQGTDAQSQQDTYHAAYGGVRMFPMGVGMPRYTSTMDATINYDAKYKPYGEASLGLGRALLEASEDGAQYGSDTLSIAFGGGVLMHFFTRWAVDFQIMYEIVQGRGGTANTIAVSGNNIYILIGNGVLF